MKCSDNDDGWPVSASTMNEEAGISDYAPASGGGKAYIYRANHYSAGGLEIWSRKDKSWQWFFSSDNPPYASVGSAERALNKLIDKGLIDIPDTKDLWEIGAGRIDWMAKQWPNRFI